MIDRVAFVFLTILVFTLPFEKSIVVPGIGTLTKAIGLLCFVAGLAAAARSRKWGRLNLAVIAAVGFVVWSATTFLWSLDRSATLARTATYVQLLAMAWLVLLLGTTLPRREILLRAYVAGAVVASLATMARYAMNLQTYYRRYAAPGFDPNDLALTVALAIPMALYLASREPGSRPWLYRSAALLAGAAILLTASRMGLVAAYLGLAYSLVAWRSSAPLQRWTGAALIVLLTLGAVALAPKASRQRISTIGTELTKGTLHRRTTIWKAGLRTLKSNPALGAGAGAYPDAVKPALGVPPIPGHEYVAHNTFLSVLVETGLIGFVFFGGLLLILTAFTWSMSNPHRALWAVMLLVWAVGVSTLTWEHRKATWLLFALIVAEWSRTFAEERPA